MVAWPGQRRRRPSPPLPTARITTPAAWKGMALFWFWWVVALFTSLLLAQPQLAMGSDTANYWYHKCSSGNFTPGSSYERGLKSVASELPRKVSSDPQFFATESIGYQVEQINALASCRGDSNASVCNSCVSDALQEAPVACPFKRSVVMLYERCIVAFSDREFTFSTNTSASDSMFLKYNKSRTIQSDEIRKGAASVIGAVIDRAAELSPMHYATGRKDLGTDGHEVYALAECRPTLSSIDCKDCLRRLGNEQTYIESSGVGGGSISSIWCDYRWASYKFFNGVPLLNLQADHHHKKHVGLIVGIVVAVGTVVTAAILLTVWCRKRRLRKRLQRSSGEKKKGVEETREVELSKKEGCSSALTSFEEIINLAQGRRIALFLDYDGTLTPIVNNPDNTFMSDEMRATVRKAAALFTTSIVSGRSRAKVMDFVQIMEINYAGSHGFDIMTSATAGSTSTSEITGEPCLYEPAKDFLSKINEVCEFLERETDGIMGATVENNKYCISIHYRNVADEDKLLVKEVVNNAQKQHSLKLTQGHMVYELRPPIDWNKGHAVGYLLKSLGLDNPENTFSVYIGDDKTDEDAFEVLREQQRGVGILVAESSKPTAAFYSVKNPMEVQTFLQKLIEWAEQ
ncbi:unnamed protein product [Urochloa humidicola]